MSVEEQVSAYQVFKTATNLGSSNNFSKRKQNGSTKIKANKNLKKREPASAIVSTKAAFKANVCKMSGRGKPSGSKHRTTTSSPEKSSSPRTETSNTASPEKASGSKKRTRSTLLPEKHLRSRRKSFRTPSPDISSESISEATESVSLDRPATSKRTPNTPLQGKPGAKKKASNTPPEKPAAGINIDQKQDKKNKGKQKSFEKFLTKQTQKSLQQEMLSKRSSDTEDSDSEAVKMGADDEHDGYNSSDEETDDEDDEDDECNYIDSDSFSGEYTINYSDTPSEVENDDQVVEDFAEAIISRANKKRKCPEQDDNKTEPRSNPNSSESKKSKKSKNANNTEPTSGKSSMNKNEKNSKNRSTLASLADLKEKPTTKNSSNTARVKLEAQTPPENVVNLNSIEEGKRVLKWLLNPVGADHFFNSYWEKKACLIKRQQNNYFQHLISFEVIDQMLLKNHVEFTKNIDVTSYKNGVRDTLNPEGRALPPVVWNYYDQDCSIRLLNPQTFLPSLHTLCATMQEYFHCLVGVNAYLTPPNSQGFAPHYDDIEAFVLQIEGRKRWKLYKPRNSSEELPRVSSRNFKQEEIGEPIMEEVLQPGDLLYFPRGTIHQALTEPGHHSLHLTLSVYQKQSFADLFEKMLPIMLEKAIASSVKLREGLPLLAFKHAGIVYSEDTSKERADLIEKVTQLMDNCIHNLPLQEIMDAGMDQLAKKFQHEALPPVILPAEKSRTIFGSHSRVNKQGECEWDYEIDERSNVRLLRANILRLVKEEEKLRIYYYLDNSKEYCQYEPNFIEIEAEEAASVEVLIKSYPQYIGVSELPLKFDDEKINLATALWEKGLLMMQKPIK